ncbi:MAG: PGRP and LysM peptidoglycan-binding domain-containing protein [Thermodesulfobacteriota bacterium]
MADYTVKQGDCLSSIASKYGLFWEKIWNHPKNAQLKEKRKDPNVLYPGDVLFIPDKEEKEEPASTEQRHRFRVKGVPAMLRLQFKHGDQPRANELYTLEIDGMIISGNTDGEGRIEQHLPPKAKRGKLLLGEYQEEFILEFGHLDPIEEISGVQARLNNLGFDCGKVDGILGPKTEAALKEFQKQYGLLVTGKIDEQTINKLKNIYGC